MSMKFYAPFQRHCSFLLIVIALMMGGYLIMVNVISAFFATNYESNQILRIRASISVNSPVIKSLDGGPLPSKRSDTKSKDKNKTSKSSKSILIWSPLYSEWNFLLPGSYSFKNKNCSVYDCEITLNRNRLLEVDAVVFHIRTMSLLDLPRHRKPNQKWIFFSLESPPYSKFPGLAFMYGMFNWTMTYRHDSDIIIPYGSIKSDSTQKNNVKGILSSCKKKKKLAVGLVSHCETESKREDYFKELQKHIDVDIFGICGRGVCPFHQTEECMENFSQNYYFFLAFENAICADYVTEKFYRTLKYDLVPVVFGGAEYEKLSPPNSYINALDFSSPKHLAMHLQKVSSNCTLFNSYLQWKISSYVIKDQPNECELCKKLHSSSFYQESVLKDINRWWLTGSRCQTWIPS